MDLHKGYIKTKASLVAQRVKRLPAMWKTWLQSLGQEDPLEKGMATHSNVLARRTPWTEKPGGLQSMGSQRVRQGSATEQYGMEKRRWERRSKHTHGERRRGEGSEHRQGPDVYHAPAP